MKFVFGNPYAACMQIEKLIQGKAVIALPVGVPCRHLHQINEGHRERMSRRLHMNERNGISNGRCKILTLFNYYSKTHLKLSRFKNPDSPWCFKNRRTKTLPYFSVTYSRMKIFMKPECATPSDTGKMLFLENYPTAM